MNENNGTKNYQKWNAITQELKSLHVDVDIYTFFRVMKLFNQIKTEKHCPHCNGTLLLSDLKQYDYLCPECDENFYECEI